jgi:hypothetical protein
VCNRVEWTKKVEASASTSGIVDTDTSEEVDWGDIFFMLHKHCGLDKWKIFNYTLPQVVELLKKAQKNIRFEIEASMSPIKAIASAFGVEFGDGEGGDETSDISDDDLAFVDEMSKI